MEDGQTLQYALLIGAEQAVAPVDRRLDRLLAVGAARIGAGEVVEAVIAAHHRLDALGDRVQPARRDLGGGELDRERQPVERAADARCELESLPRTPRSRAGRRARASSCTAATGRPRPSSSTSIEATVNVCSPWMRSGRRVVATTLTPRHPSRSAAATSPHAACTCSQLSSTSSATRSDRWRTSAADCVSPGSARTPSCVGDRRRHSIRIRTGRHLGELGEPHPIGERRRKTGDELQGQPGLAAAAGAGQRDELATGHHPRQQRELLLAAEEARRLDGQVVRYSAQRRRRGKPLAVRPGRQLEDDFAGAEVEEPLLAEVVQLDSPRRRASRADAVTSTWPGWAAEASCRQRASPGPAKPSPSRTMPPAWTPTRAAGDPSAAIAAAALSAASRSANVATSTSALSRCGSPPARSTSSVSMPRPGRPAAAGRESRIAHNSSPSTLALTAGEAGGSRSAPLAAAMGTPRATCAPIAAARDRPHRDRGRPRGRRAAPRPSPAAGMQSTHELTAPPLVERVAHDLQPQGALELGAARRARAAPRCDRPRRDHERWRARAHGRSPTPARPARRTAVPATSPAPR